jgi:hypothetical protein
VVVVDFEFIEVLFDRLDLGGIKDVLMGAYHRFGAGRPPFNPLSLLRFKVILVLKGYRSQRALEREVRVDSRLGGSAASMKRSQATQPSSGLNLG